VFGYATLSPQLALPSYCWLTDAVEGLARAGIEGATLGSYVAAEAARTR
jgi:hypothetical protein